MTMKNFNLIIVTLVLLMVGCQSQPAVPYKYQVPENINDGPDVGTLKEVGVDTSSIIKGINKIHQGSFGEVHFIIIYRGTYALVFLFAVASILFPDLTVLLLAVPSILFELIIGL